MFRHVPLTVLLVLVMLLTRQCPQTRSFQALTDSVTDWRALAERLRSHQFQTGVTSSSQTQDARGDVYDYDLKRRVHSSRADRADLARVSATAGTSTGARGGVRQLRPDGSQVDSSTWTYRGEAVSVGEWVNVNESEGVAEFRRGDEHLEVHGDARVTFFDNRIEITARGPYAKVAFQDAGGTLETTQVSLGQTHTVRLSGLNALIDYDAGADTLDVLLTEGTLDLLTPAEQTFAVPWESETALAVHVEADGDLTTEDVPMDEAGARFPPLFRSLVFAIEMAQPIAASKAEAEMVWLAMLNLDGDPTTGLTELVSNAMYAGVGADAYVPVLLQDDGALAAEIVFPGGESVLAHFPVEAAVAEDRRGLSVYVPIALLEEQVPALLGIPFALDNLTWRVAAINYTDPEHAKDVFPDLGYFGEAPAPDAAAPVPAGPQPPAGFSMSLSTSVTNGGPVATFEDKSVSPDAENPITGWLWDFGDGTTSDEQNPEHSYQNAGEYNVTLTYTFADGATATMRVPVTITRGSGVPPAESAPPEDQGAPAACTVQAGNNVNLRGGPGTNYDVVGQLAGGETGNVDGQVVGADGYTWWRLDTGAWVRADVVTAHGDCAGVPAVETP